MSRQKIGWQGHRVVIALIAALAMLAACRGSSSDDSPATTESKPGQAAPARKAPPPAGSKTSWKIETADGNEVATVEVEGATVTIQFGGKVVQGAAKGDKRRYEMDGQFVAVVKAKDDKFKLKDEGGKLLWKVKLKPDKVKVSDNEEGENAYGIKPKDGGFKVKRNDTEVGKVKFYADEGRVKVKDANGNEVFRGKADKASAAWGVLLMKDIPEAQRYVIMAEIGARGR